MDYTYFFGSAARTAKPGGRVVERRRRLWGAAVDASKLVGMVSAFKLLARRSFCRFATVLGDAGDGCDGTGDLGDGELTVGFAAGTGLSGLLGASSSPSEMPDSTAGRAGDVT